MDINLNYIEKGEGTPLILLHGNGESHDYFVHQIEYFSKTHRVIALDTRGHGLSPRGESPFTLSQFSDDLKHFLDEKQISKAVILGFSDGGNIALLFALKYPQYVEKLILNGANLNPRGVRACYQFPICFYYNLISVLSVFHKKLASKKETLALMVREPDINPLDLKKIDSPTLIIAGTRDMIKTSHTEFMAGCINKSTLKFIPGNHFIAFQSSREFNDNVAQFLSKTET